MRWFLIPTVATTALALADPAPAKAQVIVGGSPTYFTPYSVPFGLNPGVLYPGNSGVIPFVNGGPVEMAHEYGAKVHGMEGLRPVFGLLRSICRPALLPAAIPC